MASNLTVTSVLTQDLNPTSFEQSQHFGLAISAPPDIYHYGPPTTNYWYPLLQAYDDQNEFYYCFRSTRADPNKIITPKEINIHYFTAIDRTSSTSVNTYQAPYFLSYDGDINSQNSGTIYVILKNLVDFENSNLPSKNYIILKMRAANIELLYNHGVFLQYNKTEVLYIPYEKDSKEMEDINSFGLDIGVNITFSNFSDIVIANTIPSLN